MKRFALVLILIILIQIAQAKVVFMLNCYPSDTPIEDRIYIASDQNSWNPADDESVMEYKDGIFYYTLPEGIEMMEFKFTRGDWKTVECKYDGTQTKNRTYCFDEQDTIILKVENWADMALAPEKTCTASAQVGVLSEDFYIPQLDRTRKIRIYLPKDYTTTKKRYPVIYMHDGQNLFDLQDAPNGEWEVDETLDSLFDTNKKSAIVIGIDHGGDKRISELSPYVNKEYGGGEGAKYAAFIAKTLKPYVDNNYRTLKDRENTWIFGSSLGGLISFYAGITYPEVFGKVGVFSPAFWFSDSCYKQAKRTKKQYGQKMYFLAGGLEGKDDGDYDVIGDVEKMIKILRKKGYSKYELNFNAVDDGKHNEAFWQKYFPEAYIWLYDHPK